MPEGAGRGGVGSRLFQASPPEIGNDFARGVVAGGAGHAAARVRTRSAHVQSLQWAAIVAVSQHRPRREHLIQTQGAMKDIAADHAESTLELEPAHDLPYQH